MYMYCLSVHLQYAHGNSNYTTIYVHHSIFLRPNQFLLLVPAVKGEEGCRRQYVVHLYLYLYGV